MGGEEHAIIGHGEILPLEALDELVPKMVKDVKSKKGREERKGMERDKKGLEEENGTKGKITRQ